MKYFMLIFLYILLNIPIPLFAVEYSTILNEQPLEYLYHLAINDFKCSEILVEKDLMGVILRFEINKEEISKNLYSLKTYQNILRIEYFLAKIKNPVIIEVHTDKDYSNKLKNWELSTIFANKIEADIINIADRVKQNRIKSIGYGEFLPKKNTPNNGGNYSNRVDIMILCNISGE